MSVIDSTPCFEARVREFGLADHLEKFRALGWTSLGVFAFVSDYVPGVSDGSIFVKDVVLPAFGDPEHPDRFMLRRLYTEAYTLAAWETRRRCEQTSDDPPRSMANRDREYRRKQVARRLVGLSVEGDLEPSHRLQDLAYEIYDRDVVKHVPWEQCTKRESELEGTRTDKTLKVDASGFLKETSSSEPAAADTSSDYMLQCALRRRAIAFEMADLASFETMESVTNVMLRELHRNPLAGFAKVTHEQLRRADLELFQQLADLCRDSVKRGSDGLRPFDVHIPNIINSPRFRFLLYPLPGGSSSRAAVADDSASGASSSKRKQSLEQSNRDLRAENKRLRVQAQSRQGSSSYTHSPSGGGGGKGAGRGGKGGQGKGSANRDRSIRMPAALIGKSNQTAAGEPICFHYNMAVGCTQAAPGAKCSRGWHVCAEPGCNATHSLTKHAS